MNRNSFDQHFISIQYDKGKEETTLFLFFQ